MLQTISIDDAEALQDALEQTFKRCALNGRATLPDRAIRLGELVVPPGAPVHFTPTEFLNYTKHFKVVGRDCSHAIIFVDERRGATVRIDGTCKTILTRNCQ